MNKTDRHAVAIPKGAPFAHELDVGAKFYSQILTEPALYYVVSKRPFTIATVGGDGTSFSPRRLEPVWPEAQAAEREAAVRTHRALQEAGAQHEAAGLAPSFTPTPAVTNDQWHAVIERAWRFRTPDSDYHPGAVEITQRDLTLAAAMQAAEQRAKADARHAQSLDLHDRPTPPPAQLPTDPFVGAEPLEWAKTTDVQPTREAYAADVEAAYREGYHGRECTALNHADSYWAESTARAKLAT